MPTCRDMSELVTDYMEGAVPLRTRISMRVHLMLCDACRAYFDQMRRTVRLLARGAPIIPDPATEESMLALRRRRPPHGA